MTPKEPNNFLGAEPKNNDIDENLNKEFKRMIKRRAMRENKERQLK